MNHDVTTAVPPAGLCAKRKSRAHWVTSHLASGAPHVPTAIRTRLSWRQSGTLGALNLIYSISRGVFPPARVPDWSQLQRAPCIRRGLGRETASGLAED